MADTPSSTGCRPRRVAITGGIGCGKSTVTDRLAELGAVVIDADIIAHRLTAPGKPLTRRIVEQFGITVEKPDGTLDRAALGVMVFRDTSARETLESMLHPEIRREMLARADRSRATYVVLSIPLLTETGQYQDMDYVVVVEADESRRIQRVMDRSGYKRSHVQQILENQASDEERRQIADEIIDNNGSLDALYTQVDDLFRRLQSIR